jgi:alpha-tubulin suppressor-like RCC1 family protein
MPEATGRHCPFRRRQVPALLVGIVLLTTRCGSDGMESPAQPVVSVTVGAPAGILPVGGSEQLTTTLKDAAGTVLSGRTVAWSSSDPAVGTVSAGLVTAVAPGTVTITATSEGVSGTAGVTVIHLAFTSLSAGDHRTCGVTAAGRAACWGGNDYGGLGDGSTAQHSTPVLVASSVAFAAVSAAGGESFDPGDHACGVSAGGATYCWGFNSFGQLGDGTTTGPERCLAGVPCSTAPLAVLGGLTFTMVSANHLRSCGVTTGAAAYCWGSSPIGDGTGVPRPAPTAVAGALAFATVSVGHDHTCGLTEAGAAYCWGSNVHGEIGDGITADQDVPVAVAGGLSFTGVTAGYKHTCAVTAAGAAYCWGLGASGELGDGTSSDRPTPVAVAGGLAFSEVSAGTYHTCGITSTGSAYCWGFNGDGELGDGSTAGESSPVPVGGGIAFAAISSGDTHSCGVTADGTAYCWGDNSMGQLGDGSTDARAVPTRVVQ